MEMSSSRSHCRSVGLNITSRGAASSRLDPCDRAAGYSRFFSPQNLQVPERLFDAVAGRLRRFPLE